MIIIGLGTGRCGTLSLSKLLTAQGSTITHEMKPLPKWDLSNMTSILDRIIKYKTNKNEYCGDVCSGYLNYIERIYDELGDDVRFICLERNKEDNIKSWMNKTGEKNYWYTKGSKDAWSVMFPKYDNQNKEECLSKYWNEYHEKTNNLQKKIPVFKKIKTKELNDKESIIKILRFCLITPRNTEKVHVNATKQ